MPTSLIKNRPKILQNDPFFHKRIVLDSLESAIDSVRPKALVANRISVKGTRFLINELALDLDLNKFDRIIVVGGGKASGGLAEVLDSTIPRGIDVNGLVIVVEGTSRNYKTRRIQLLEACHPLPDIRGEKATQSPTIAQI